MNEFCGCDHIGLFTNNPERLIKFYTEKLEFKKEKDDTLSESITKPIFNISVDCRLIRLKDANGAKIEIFQPIAITLPERKENLSGYNHWAY